MSKDPGVSYYEQGEIPDVSTRDVNRASGAKWAEEWNNPENFPDELAHIGTPYTYGGIPMEKNPDRPDALVYSMSDMVNSPPHYNKHPKGIECIDVIEDFNSPNLANVVKYAWRVDFGGKWDDLEDLEKLIWYGQRELDRRRSGAEL